MVDWIFEIVKFSSENENQGLHLPASLSYEEKLLAYKIRSPKQHNLGKHYIP
jgi:hypothetical protein